MNLSEGFIIGWLQGTLGGLVALFVGLLVAEIARYIGFPKWMTAGLGIWAFLCAIAILWPPREDDE